MAAGLLRRRLCQRPSGDDAGGRRRRSRRRRRQHRLDRRGRRAEGRPAERRRRSGPDLLSRRRHRADHHRRQCRAGPASAPTIFSAARCGSMPTARARGIAANASPSRSAWTTHRGGARHHRHRDRQNVARRCARCRSRRAMIRAISRSSPRAARGRCTSSRSRASCTFRPSSCRCFPSHFSALGMLMADERHDFIRTYYRRSRAGSISRALAADRTTRWPRRRGAACATRTDAQHQIQLDLRYVGQEFTLSVPVSVRADRAPPTARRSAPRSTRSTSSATRTIRRTSRSRSSTCGSSRIGKRAAARASRACRRRGAARRPSSAPVYFGDARKPVECPVYRRDDLPRGRAHRRAGAHQEYGSTTVLFAGDRRAAWRAIRANSIICGGESEPDGGNDSIRSRSRSSATRCRPIANEMAADLQRTSYNMMIYEVRDFCTALVAPDGELDLAERRRRLAFRRRSRRHHQGRHEALRQATASRPAT